MVLSEFVGNEEVIYEISETMKNRLLPHAILIEGVKGSGKRSLARILAQYAVCSAEGDRPCGVCPACIKAEKSIHPDIVTADGSKAGELNIEAVRSIRSAAYIKPNEGENRVFLMHFCEKMLPAAQNAFLKVLEEPPQNVLFVLTAVSATSLLQTIRSRTRIYSLYPPSVTEAETVLKKMFPDKDASLLSEAAQNSGGNIGAAIELLNTGGEEEKKTAEAIFRAIPLSTEYALLTETFKITKDRSFAITVLERLYELSAECLKASCGAKNVSPIALELSKTLSKKRLQALFFQVQKARDVLKYNVNLNFYSTWLCSVLRRY